MVSPGRGKLLQGTCDETALARVYAGDPATVAAADCLHHLEAVLGDVHKVEVAPLVPHPEAVALAGHGHGEVLPGDRHLLELLAGLAVVDAEAVVL